DLNGGDCLNEVSSSGELVEALLEAIEQGRGFEVSIGRPEVSAWLSSSIEADELKVGGQAGVSAEALAALGVGKVYLHSASMTEALAKLIRGRGILIPRRVDGALKGLPPLEACRKGQETMVHWVFEFHEGYTVNWRGRRIEAPRGDRFIASYDPLNSSLHVDPDYADFMEEAAAHVDKALISGFHLLKPRYPDGSTFKERIAKAEGLLKRWRSLNQDMWLHMEQAYTANRDLLLFAVERLSRLIDSYGLNEVELDLMLEALGSGPAGNILEAALKVVEAFRLRCLVLHAEAFSIAIAEGGVDSGWLTKALWFGAMLAAAKTVTGRDVSIDEVLGLPGLNVSFKGYELYAQLTDALGLNPLEALRRGVEYKGYDVAFAPALSNPKPRIKVGLGDSFASGFLACTPASPRWTSP
ncbi:MAG: ADP-dependent glucokinase/phosphofructokinase, partial [Desulfurococcaceae archaeon]